MPDAAHADEPVVEPPPVDALLALLDQWLETDVSDMTANAWIALRQRIVGAGRELWGAGVAEGRRQRDAEIHAEVLASARAVAEAGFGPVPESVTVSYERTEESNPDRSICRHCGGKIWLDGAGRWRHRDGMQECEHGPGDVAAPDETLGQIHG